jgi:hypothetical protein
VSDPTVPTDPTDVRKHIVTLVDVVAANTRAIDRQSEVIAVATAAVAGLVLAFILTTMKGA